MELNKDNMKKIMLLILYTIVILALAFRMEYVFGFLRGGLRLMFPFLLGAAIAFILNVPMRFIEKNILGGLLRMKETSRAKRPLSLLLAILFVLVIVAVVSLVVIPELTGTLLGLKRLVPAFFENMQIQAEAMFARYPEIVEFINSIEIDWKTLMEETASFRSGEPPIVHCDGCRVHRQRTYHLQYFLYLFPVHSAPEGNPVPPV